MNNPIKVLIIDDDEIGIKPFIFKLKKRGLVVDYLKSGVSIKSQIEPTQYDIILLDFVMPDMSGHEVLKEIRKYHSQLEQPVIMVSGNEDVSDVVESLKLGANDYIVKPANIDIAMARIQTQVMLSKYYKLTIKKRELEAIHALVITYSHEINNPLTVLLAHSNKLKLSLPDHPSFAKIDESINRMIGILNKIKSVSESESSIEFEPYARLGSKKLKLSNGDG